MQDLESFIIGLLFVFAGLIIGFSSYKCYHYTRLCWFRRCRKYNIEDLEKIMIIEYDNMEDRRQQGL
jgi:hypothetical protein